MMDVINDNNNRTPKNEKKINENFNLFNERQTEPVKY